MDALIQKLLSLELGTDARKAAAADPAVAELVRWVEGLRETLVDLAERTSSVEHEPEEGDFEARAPGEGREVGERLEELEVWRESQVGLLASLEGLLEREGESTTPPEDEPTVLWEHAEATEEGLVGVTEDDEDPNFLRVIESPTGVRFRHKIIGDHEHDISQCEDELETEDEIGWGYWIECELITSHEDLEDMEQLKIKHVGPGPSAHAAGQCTEAVCTGVGRLDVDKTGHVRCWWMWDFRAYTPDEGWHGPCAE